MSALVAALGGPGPRAPAAGSARPTDDRDPVEPREHLALRRGCARSADADRHDRHAQLHREVGGAANSSAISGPAWRVPSGKIATGSPAREHRLERPQRGAVGGAALDLDRAELVEEPVAERRCSNSSSLARNRTRARRDVRGERDVEDRAVRRGDDVRARRGHALLADHPHPEHHA